MGTRSLTFVYEYNCPDPIICIYQQYDGYFEGVGQSIIDFLDNSEVVNGIGISDHTVFNGAGDLAARLITNFKSGDASCAGGVYIVYSDLCDDDMGAEYSYHIYCTVGEAPRLVARDVLSDTVIYDSNEAKVIDPEGPLTDDQRSALFATFKRLYDDEGTIRADFTRSVLGPDAPTSWSRGGGLTAGQAGRLLDVLKFMVEA